MRRLAWIAAILALAAGGLVLADWWFGVPDGTKASYVGGKTCTACHADQHKAWHGSDHDLAMALATPQTVLGDFNDSEFTYHEITTRFSRQGEKFVVETDGPDGTPTTYEIKYTFGVRPLQQYLIELDRGRIQALSIAWDTKQKCWFHLYQDDPQGVRAGDPIHWTGPGQNWNHTCAECHSTDLKKNYDPRTQSFRTSYAEINVSCEACHGPGSVHVDLAKSWSLFWDRKLGYGLNRLKGQPNTAEIETCARCHAHRSVAQEGYHAGLPFLDHYAPALLDSGLYFDDGQILEEAYEYGSFLQSLMYRKNVRCTDCHDPHRATVRLTGNALCTTKCHLPARYDVPAHHHHAVDSKGAQCIECHMPVRKYMVVDPRRDHSVRPPRPDLSVLLGTPNACTACHVAIDTPRLVPESAGEEAKTKHPDYAAWLAAAGRGDEPAKGTLRKIDDWAAQKIVQWYGPKRREDPHFALAMAAGMRGELEESARERGNRREELAEIVRRLGKLARDDVGPIVRASAVSLLGRYATADALKFNDAALADKEPLVRLAAVRNLAVFEPVEPLEIWTLPQADAAQKSAVRRRLESLRKKGQPFLADPVRTVRMEAARVLAIVPTSYFESDDELKAFQAAFREFRDGQLANADTASAHANMGQTQARMGDLAGAELAYREAIKIQPSFVPARLELAVICNFRGQNSEAEKLLREAIEIMPELADSHFSLGRLLAEDESRLGEAVVELQKAAEHAPKHARIRYNYGLALQFRQQHAEAERELLAAYNFDPDSTDFTLALVSFYRERQRWSAALPYAEQLARMLPDAAEVQALLREIRGKAAGEAPTSGVP